MTDQTRPPRADLAEREAPETAGEIDSDVARLLGLRPAGSDPMPGEEEVDTLGQMTDTRIYQGDLEARPPGVDQPDHDAAENLEMLIETELREGETDDPNEAAEEGLAWVPPIDPPLRIGDDGPEVAAGFGTTAQDEPFDADHHAEALSELDEIEARVVEALRADATTAGLADGLAIDAEGGRVVIAGPVDDLEDEEAVLTVAAGVSGVRVVVNRLDIRSLQQPGGAR
jgi:hypothetical protein